MDDRWECGEELRRITGGEVQCVYSFLRCLLYPIEAYSVQAVATHY